MAPAFNRFGRQMGFHVTSFWRITQSYEPKSVIGHSVNTARQDRLVSCCLRDT